MESPVVSLLVPIFNVEPYIEKCLHSLFAQSFKSIEYVFVNDCTPDRSIEKLWTVLNQYPDRKQFVKVINHNTNQGLSAARKTALLHATGSYVWHIDSDDYIALDAVEKLYEKASSLDADMVVFDVMELYSDNKNKIVENAIPLDKKEYLKLLLIRQRRYELCFRFCKKELYKGLELDTEIGFGEDYATTPRLACIANKVVKLDSICYYYIKYNQSSYTKSISIKAVQSIERAMLLLESFFQNRDCCEYNEILQISKMYLKVHMLKGTVYNAESFLYANNLFPELHNASLSQIKFKDNILLLINRYKWYGILKVYIKLGLALVNKK